jgi:N-acyl-D-amino-acid deacylase
VVERAEIARGIEPAGALAPRTCGSQTQANPGAMVEAADGALAGVMPLVISHHKCAPSDRPWGLTRQTLALVDALAARQAIARDVHPWLAGSTSIALGRWLADLGDQWSVGRRSACCRLHAGAPSDFQMREDDLGCVIARPRSMIGSEHASYHPAAFRG